MTRQMMQELMEHVFTTEIQKLREEGQKEYAHDEENALANFDRQAEEMDINPEQVLWVYAMKHRDGIAAHIKGHTSQREDIRGRINDLIVYLFLLRGMIERRDASQCKNADDPVLAAQEHEHYYGSEEIRRKLEESHAGRVLGGRAMDAQKRTIEDIRVDRLARGCHEDPQSGDPLAKEFGGVVKAIPHVRYLDQTGSARFNEDEDIK